MEIALQIARTGNLGPREKVAVSRARLYMQANPLQFKGKGEEVWPTAPTKQQQAKQEFHRSPEAGGVYSHRVKRVFENISKHYPDAVLLALTKFYFDAEAATRVNVTIRYDATGGSDPSAKWGGLGNVQEQTRLQYARHERIIQTLRSISEDYIDVLRWLVTEVRKHSDERMPGIGEAGRRLVPSITHEAVRRGVSIGYLLAVGHLLIHLYRHDRLQHGDEYRRNHDEFDDPGR